MENYQHYHFITLLTFRATISCVHNPEDQPPILKFTTMTTSTTNLFTSSYLHLKDLLDSRRNSRQSNVVSSCHHLSPNNHVRGREMRSCSLGNSTNMLLLPTCHFGGHIGGQRTNLSRQTSVSDGGGKICPRFGDLWIKVM